MHHHCSAGCMLQAGQGCAAVWPPRHRQDDASTGGGSRMWGQLPGGATVYHCFQVCELTLAAPAACVGCHLLHLERPGEVDAAMLGRQLVCEAAVSSVAAKEHCLPSQHHITGPRTLAAPVSALRYCWSPRRPAVHRRQHPCRWLGDNVRYTRALFSLAAKLSPCVIFVDEVDSMLSSRDKHG